MTAPDKIKLPSLLPLQLIYTTDYCEYCIYFFDVVKKLGRKKRSKRAHTEDSSMQSGLEAEYKAALRMYRRLLSCHQKQLRERRKAVSQFLFIKYFLKDKNFFTPADVAAIAQLCDYKTAKTFHSNIEVLQALHLIEYRKENCFVASWDKLCEVFKIGETYPWIRWHYLKPGGEIKLEEKLLRVAMEKKERQCKDAAFFKLNKITEVKDMLSSVSGRVTTKALNELQEAVFINPSLSVHLDLDRYVLFEVCRGDTALGYKLWSCLLGYKSIGGFAHVKRRMIKSGLIAVLKNEKEMPDGVHTTVKSRSCCVGRMIYNRPVWKDRKLQPGTSGKIIFYKPDTIIYLPLNPAA